MSDETKEPEPVAPQESIEPELPEPELPEMGQPEFKGGKPGGEIRTNRE
jgi:hypothetical protein